MRCSPISRSRRISASGYASGGWRGPTFAGTSAEVYVRTGTRFLADFLGQINLLGGRVGGDEGHWWVVEVARTALRAPRNGAPKAGSVITVGVRPEQLRLLSPEADPGGRNA